MRSMAGQFRIIDRDRSGMLDKEEFDLALDILFSYYDVHFTRSESSRLLKSSSHLITFQHL